MRIVSKILLAGAAVTIFAVGAAAQHEGHHSDAAAPPAKAAASDTQKPCGMMAQKEQAAAETSNLADQLLKSYEAIQAEKDPAALKQKLAEHGTLLKELQSKVQAQPHKMEMMQQKMAAPAGKEDKK